jgi:hypothetical protein
MTQSSEAGERKRTLVAVRSAESAPGQYGPQWALQVTYPWMKAGRTAKAWIPRDEFAPAPEPGQYSCLVEKGSKWATESEGDEDWMHNWRLIGGLSGVEDAEPTDATPTAPKPIAPLPDRDPTRVSIERQVAGKEVGETIRALIAKGIITDMPTAVKHFVDNIEEVYQAIAGTLEKPQAARTEEKPPQRPEDMMDGTDEPFPAVPW